jgi:adenine specific DNA methylase Mod
MANQHFHEQQFFNALRDIFVGAEIEGDSGFINLMKIKSRYYQQGVFPRLKQDIDQAVADYPEFREELFNKLYTFFQRYFSESGSIYFRYTPLHQNIYEKVYTDDRDVVLFWKTHMLYYVKTDRIFKSLKVDVDEVQFYFDASNIENKRANEKRDVVFTFREVAPDGALVFDCAYSVRGRITKIEEILRDLRKEDVYLSDETLEKAFRVFEKQSEVDYFINKNARAFLEEQFDLWLYQYLFAEKNIWSAERLAQLQALKEIATKVIGFISQFEDELVKIWNKPKFVRNSHYIITLDHFIKRAKVDLLEELFTHDGMNDQIDEWSALGILENSITKEELFRNITEMDLLGEPVNSNFQTLSFDTKYFAGLEQKLLTCFDNIDEDLDGWLIHSENYQALSTKIRKYSDKVKCIYIDPPYNTGNDDFVYKDRFQHSTWLTMMENRLNLSRQIMCKDGAIFISIDENEVHRLNNLLVDQFGENNFAALLIARTNPRGRTLDKYIAKTHEYIITFVKNPISSAISEVPKGERMLAEYNKEDYRGKFRELGLRNRNPMFNRKNRPNLFFPIYINRKNGKVALNFSSDFSIEVYPRNSQGVDDCWTWSKEKIAKSIEDLVGRQVSKGGWRIFRKDYMRNEEGKVATTMAKSIWLDKSINNERGKEILKDLMAHHTIDFPKSVDLIVKCIEIGAIKNSIVLDFFAGSGTTAHAVMNLNREDGGTRKYILVEMGDHFYDVILPRIKKVAFNSKWKDGKPVFEEGESGISHFVKYYELEQYEEVLQKAHYEDADLFDDPDQDPYHSYVFLRDLKLLDSLDVDLEKDKVTFHPERLYPDIDLAETLSHLKGKWIKRITEEYVEFEHGERMSLTDPDWETLKPMIWWQ